MVFTSQVNGMLDTGPIKRTCSAESGDHLANTTPVKRTRPADFSSILRRSHSLDEFSLEKAMAGHPKAKVINDSIHGHIQFPPVAVAIIDTSQFQRLRFLKQVGNCHFVYPTATHTRFQHSLGVGYLAFKFAEELRKQNPTLVDEKDVLCVMLAGLCHDLGHGPYSHLWEAFVREANPASKWRHEDNSIRMIDYLIQANNLMPVLGRAAGLTHQDILFVKEQIAGPINPATGLAYEVEPDTSDWLYRGRSEDKSFLYEVVANKISGIDVDKWDYFLRDDYYLKIGHIFDYSRFMSYSRVIKTGNPERRRICIRDKEAELLFEMFQDRARLHLHGYQHRVTRIIDRMMLEAWLLADKYIKVKGTNGKELCLSEACQDIIAHEKLTDGLVFYKILYSESEEQDVKEAQNILKRILSRDFYKSVATIRVPKGSLMRGVNTREILQDIQQHLVADQGGESLKPQELVVLKRRVTMGMGDRNPIENVTFYDKHLEVVDSVDSMNINHNLPDVMQDETLFICVKRNEHVPLKQAIAAIKDWSAAKNIKIDYSPSK